jgi:CHAT domain-containing protein
LFVELTDLVPFLPVDSMPLPDGSDLAERYALSYVPSAATYLTWRSETARPSLASRPALAVADPRLPFARDEVQSLAALFPQATILKGSEATKRGLERLAAADRLRDYGVVHLATHMISPWHHERAALRVADGLVELPEIAAGWRLDADLVTLSGCRSMTGHDYPERGEYLGFPQALFAVGARAVVASLWEVDDEAASLLMRRFYESLVTDRRSAAVALREARLWLREYTDERGARPFEHPIYWSGFILLGAPDERSRLAVTLNRDRVEATRKEPG